MSSGYFPLDKYDDHYAILVQAANLVESVIDAHAELARELTTPEDAALDGKYVGYLQVAVELIRRCLR